MCVLLWIIFFSQTSEVSAINTPDSEPRGYKYSQSRDNRRTVYSLWRQDFLQHIELNPKKLLASPFLQPELGMPKLLHNVLSTSRLQPGQLSAILLQGSIDLTKGCGVIH